MAYVRKISCPYCTYKNASKNSMEKHLNKKHDNELPLGADQVLFNHINRYNLDKKYGKSVIFKRDTDWNPQSKRYNRFSSDREKEIYVKTFQERMKKKYGKTHLLDNPDVQRKMLASRKISGQYQFEDGTKFDYTGSYEKDFLEVMDKELNWDPKDICMPAPKNIEYKHEGKTRVYIPDAYIPSLNLIIEIKASDNKHYRKRDLPIELKKDKAVEDQGYNYIKIMDKNYQDFVLTLLESIDLSWK